MKKFYSFLTAAVLATFAASAFNVNPAPFTGSKIEKEGNFVESTVVAKAHKAPAMHKAPASVDELLGNYKCSFADYSLETPAYVTYDATIEAGKEANEVKIIGLGRIPLPVVAKVDLAAATITIELQMLEGFVATTDAPDTPLSIGISHGVWDADGQGYSESKNAFVGKISDGKIEFDVNDIFFFDAYTEDGSELVGTIGIIDSLVMTKSESASDIKDYEVIGKATFQDGWLIPGMLLDNTEAQYIIEVELAQNKNNPNKYALVDPYSHSNYTEFNAATNPGYIVFDITDPECVLVNTGFYSGYTDSNGDFYFYNVEAWYIEYYAPSAGMALTIDDLKAIMKDAGLPCSTYDKESGVVSIPNCVFGITANPMAAYGWSDDKGNPVDMIAKITLPNGAGVADVEVNNNAPVEYFNLQGIKVENPESGLYIRRKGNTVEKIYIR